MDKFTKKRNRPKKTTLTGGPQKAIPNGIPRLQKKIGSNIFLIFEVVFFADFWEPGGNQLGASWEPVGNQYQLGASWEPVDQRVRITTSFDIPVV